jgi:phosphatidylserine decarboxylase
MRSLIQMLSGWEEFNFLVTNRIPRRWATHIIGIYSTIESPWLTKLTIFVWKLFARDLDLGEAKKTQFNSLRDCFTRELKDGARNIDSTASVAISPCDAIVGEFGEVQDQQLFQAKGFPYRLDELITDKDLQEKYRRGKYITLRLKSSMYHRFHSPIDGMIQKLTYISGDCWNVNPVALKRVQKLFCKNERAFFELKHPEDDSKSLLLVPVAAVLVASMKFHCLPEILHLNYRGPNRMACNSSYKKGEELGYFLNGSTIIVFASEQYRFSDGVVTGSRILMGQKLLQLDGSGSCV